MFGTKEMIVIFAAVGIVGPPVAHVLISLRRRSRTIDSNTLGRVSAPAWQLSHKLGNVFALTNITGHGASDVAISSNSAAVEVRLRNAPWPRVSDGATVEFVVMSEIPATGKISINWTADDGTSSVAEVSLACGPVDGLVEAF